MSAAIEVEFDGLIIEWRGPSPFHFVPVAEDVADVIRDVAAAVSYGWGVIPVRALIGSTACSTSLFPKNGGYLVPVKDVVRKGECLNIGDRVAIRLTIDMSRAS